MKARTAVKTIVVFILLIGTILSLWYGVAYLVFGVRWGRLGGAALIAFGLWIFVLALDLSLGRPPQFSSRPWERPWERT